MVKKKAQQLALRRIRFYLTYLESAVGECDSPQPWVINALDRRAWMEDESWRKGASESMIRETREACEDARDYLTEDPPNVAGAVGRLHGLLGWLRPSGNVNAQDRTRASTCSNRSGGVAIRVQQ